MKSRRKRQSRAARLGVILLIPFLLFGLGSEQAEAQCDLVVTDLRAPTGTIPVDVPVTIDFDVFNLGPDPSVKGEIYIHIYRIPSSGFPIEVYYQRLSTSVGAGATITPTTPNWTPDAGGQYEIEIDLFAVNDNNFDNNLLVREFTVASEIEPACTEAAPTRSTMRGDFDIANNIFVGIESGESLVLTYAAGPDCCWDIDLTIDSLHGGTKLVADEAPMQRSTEGAPAVYTLRLMSSEPLKDIATFEAYVNWTRCDSPSVKGSESIVILVSPPEGIASTKQKTTAATPAAGKSGDPVNTATGELFIPWMTDLSIGVDPPLSFRRYYASELDGFFAPTDAIGTNWSHNYAWSIEQIDSMAIVVMPSGRRILFALQADGMWQLRDRHETDWQLVRQGGTWRFGNSRRALVRTFDASGELTTIVDRAGNERRMIRQGDELVGVEDDHGRRLEIGYTAGKITSVTDGSRTVRYTYNGDLLVDVTDPRGNSTTMTYDNKGHGLLTAMQRPEGNSPFTQTFDTEQRVVTQTDATGALWNFAYGDGVTTMTGPDGTTEEHHHSPARELRKRVDQEENDFDVLYDNKGRAIAVIDRLGDTTRTTYDDASGLPRSITGADGSTTSYEWNATTIEGITFRDLVRVDHPDGSTSRMTYNAAGYLTSLVDRRGKTTSFTYNDDRQLITLTTPDGETTRQTHGPTGLRDSIIGPDGRTTVIKYDALDRPIAIESPDGTTDQIAYDANNNRTLLTDAAGESTGYEYDRNNNVTAVIDAEGQRTTFLYDVLDRRIASIDAEGRRTAQIYDNRGRIVAVANGAGDTLRLMYDRAGRLLSITDADGKSLVREIDAEGITTAIIDQKGNRSTFATDQMGRPTSITDPLGRATTVAYNSLGQVTSLTDPIGQIQDWNYDNGGQMTEWTTSGGITASYDYSDLGFLASLTDPLGNRWSFVQDANGRLTSERDPLDNEIGYRYDDAGDLAAFMLPGDLGTVTFVRDARGNATEIGYPDGSSERFGYDRNGRTTSGTGFAFSYDRSGLVDTVNGIAIGRDDAGRIDRLVYGPGKEITYRYDNRGFLAEVSDWIGGTTSMQYDETGKITALTRPNGLTTNWTYDAAGYLTGIAEGDRARITLQQDELGRTTSAERSGYLMPMITNDTTSRTYNAATQIAEASYDKLGRLLDDDARTYQWDAASRVTTMSETGGTSSTWQYDARGNVVARTTNGETTASIRNYGLGRPTLAIERGNNGSDERYYVHAPSGYLLYSIDAADDDRRFYHYDEVGSTLLLSDESGTITDRYAYTPYGASAGREGESPNRFTFVGAFGVEQESADGLYRMGARLYDASSARFISRDPARLVHPKQLNPYRYALGNPLSYIDVDGRKETLAQRETREIRSMDPESGLGQLAKVLVGNSAPRTPDLTVDVMGSDGDDNEITIGNNDVKSKLDDDDIDGLNDREHLFGSGDIASTYTPGQARKRIRSVSGDASGPGHLPNSNPSGNKPGAPSGSITESPFFGQPVPGPFDSVKRAFVFPKGLFAPPKGSGGALSRDVQDYLPLVIKLFLEGLSDPTHPFSFTAPPLTQREAPTKIFIEFNGQLLPVILPKGAIILEFPKVLVTPNPGDDDPDELGDGEEIL